MSSAFFKTTITLEVLSEDTDVSNMSLEDIAFAITEGDCSGMITKKKITKLTKRQVENALVKQGSSHDFFNLGIGASDDD